jgi:hypothetical protein
MTRFDLLATTAGSAVLALALLPGVAGAAGSMSVTFDAPGMHDFKVPKGVEILLVDAVGEQGGAGARSDGSEHPGGFGGLVRARVRVRPGASYWAGVDTGGGRGGRGRWPGGAGGGASVFAVCDFPIPDPCKGMRVLDQSRLIVAAGGGGTAGGHATSDGQGGDADAPGGAGDRSPYDPIWTTGANPGSQAAGGAPGWGLGAGGGAGSHGLGGAGGGLDGSYAGGGGGGGGWYGGGGGGASSYQVPVGGGGGAGGANHVEASEVESSFSVGKATTGRPSVTVTWLDSVAPVVAIETPANTVGVTPILRGNARTELGDEPNVQVAILAAGKVVQQLSVAPDASGRWSAQPSPLGPGAYTATVLQYDRVRNIGAANTATFTVSPTPTAAPTATAQQAEPEPVHTSTQPVPPAAQAPAVIWIETARAHLRRGILSLRLTCTGAAGQRCSGRLTLTARRGERTITVGSSPYAVMAGRRATVRVRIHATPRLRRVIARAGAVARPIALAP